MEKQTRSVRFSPIEDEACVESSNGGSEFSLVLEGITLEEVYVGSLFENEKNITFQRKEPRPYKEDFDDTKELCSVLVLCFSLALAVLLFTSLLWNSTIMGILHIADNLV